MSRKKTTYSTELKTKLVIEVLKGERTLNEIASANNIIPKNLQNWKATFESSRSTCPQVERIENSSVDFHCFLAPKLHLGAYIESYKPKSLNFNQPSNISYLSSSHLFIKFQFQLHKQHKTF